jgi:hypothetical protein
VRENHLEGDNIREQKCGTGSERCQLYSGEEAPPRSEDSALRMDRLPDHMALDG